MNNFDYLEAGRSETAAGKLRLLSRHSCAKIRARVAENAATSEDLLSQLSKDECEDVRISVGSNPITPLKIRFRLAVDEHPDVRYSIAENAATDLLILFCLVHDDNPYVSQRALQTIKRIAYGRKHNSMQRLMLFEQGLNQVSEQARIS